jgi:hypothetical protein
MANIKIALIDQYTKEKSTRFNAERLKYLQSLTLSDLLSNENPYIFKVWNIQLISSFIRRIIDDCLSSQENSFLDNFLIELAIFINENTYNGWKSSSQGIDLEFIKDNIRYIVTIKSGPNWGNSRQIQ